MKKNHEYVFYWEDIKKLLRIMKITALLIVILCVNTFASSYAQSTKFSFSMKDAAIEDILKHLENESDYYFFLKQDDKVLDKRLNVNFKNASIDIILNDILKDTGLNYKVVDKYIAITQSQLNGVAQPDKVSGTVIDTNGEALPGVSVVVKGTTIGITTDLDGNYLLDIPESAQVLVFSFVGMKSQEVSINGQTTINVTLEEDAIGIEEVVAVGYGVQKKINLTGAIGQVTEKEIQNRPLTNVSQGLSGLVPGLTVVQNSGQPGSDTGTIRIRGIGSFSGSRSEPMTLVDGIEASINQVDPSDIESISILKDAASAAIYGSKAANGVIIITTKKGKAGKTKVQYNANFGWQDPTDLVDKMESAEYAVMYNEALAYAGQNPRWSDSDIQKFKDGSSPYTHPNTDWQDLFYTASGLQQKHNVSVSGGNDNVTFMNSVGYQDQTGIIEVSSFERYTLRSNVHAKLSDKVSSNVKMAYTRSLQDQPTNPYTADQEQIFRQVNRISPWVPYKHEDGTYGTIGDGNPIAWMDIRAKNDINKDYFTGLADVNYQITNELSVKAIASFKSSNTDDHEMVKDIQYNATKYHGPNKMWQRHKVMTQKNGDVLINYNKTFNDIHKLSAMGGYHAELYKYKYTEAFRKNFPSNDLGDINAGSKEGMEAKGYSRELSMISWFGRATYNYKEKYLFEANLRADASSRFDEDNRWGVFPSFSGAWRVSEEDFMEGTRDVISNLKIRGSWGELGNQNIGDFYPSLATYAIGKNYPIDDSLQTGTAITSAKKQDISWEKTTTWGIGVDADLWETLHVTLDYYNRETSDIIMDADAPIEFGMKGYKDNIGKMLNKGIEVTAQYRKKVGEFEINVGGNFALNDNEVKSLGQGVEMMGSGQTRWIVGHPIDSYYGYRTDGLFQTQSEVDAYYPYVMSGKKRLPGDIRFVDTDGDNEITGKDRVILESQQPKYTFGFNVGTTWRQYDFTAFFQGVAGCSRYMSNEAYGYCAGDDGTPTTFWRDRWTPDNLTNKVPRASLSGEISLPSTLVSDFWERDGSYLRLKNVQLGYNFPKSWCNTLRLGSVRVYYSGQNLWTISDMPKGMDPELPSGRGASYPQLRVNSFGLNVSF
ncbi:SusC/RagA family TonB-linked outer membrane protein [Puteibacter caeruleilacunae]|nr:SusC/RagA family TonB-linked outer membrane protein [Puteibacter caeruleilacunae]